MCFDLQTKQKTQHKKKKKARQQAPAQTKQNKTKQNKTKHNKTKNKCLLFMISQRRNIAREIVYYDIILELGIVCMS